MFIVSVMPSSQLILWCTLLLLPSIFTSISEFFDESSVHIRWPKYWIFSFNIVFPVNMQGWSPLRLTGLISLLSKGLLGVFSSTTVWRHKLLGVLPSVGPFLSTVGDHWEDHGLDNTDLCWQSNVCAFQHCLGLSSLSCHEAIIFWFYGYSHHLQWFWSLRRGNLSLLPPVLLLYAMK